MSAPFSSARAEDTLAAAKAAFQAFPSMETVEYFLGRRVREGPLREEAATFFLEIMASLNGGRGLSPEELRQRASCAYALAYFMETTDWASASRYFEEAAADYWDAGCPGEAAMSINSRGLRLLHRGDLGGAKRDFETGIRLDPSHPLVAANLGAVFDALGEYEEGLRWLEFSADRCLDWDPHSAGAARCRAQAVNDMGNIYMKLGDYERALALYLASLPLRGSYLTGAAQSHNNIGSACAALGDYASALHHLHEGLRMRLEEGSSRASRSYQNIGSLYQDLGDHALAASYYQKSLEIRRKSGDAIGTAEALRALGGAYAKLGRRLPALQFLHESLESMRAMKYREGEAAVLQSIGELHHEFGELEEARNNYMESLRISRELGNRSMEASTMLSLCENAIKRGDAAGAGLWAERGRNLASGMHAHELVFAAYRNMGVVLLMQSRAADAVPYLRKAMEAAERVRGSISESGQKSGFLETKVRAYEGLVEALLASAPPPGPSPSPLKERGQGAEANEAFSVAERMRARSFLDEIGAARFAREGVPPELMEKKRLLEARMKWLAERQ